MLITAAKQNSIAAIKILLNNGVDVNGTIRTDKGIWPAIFVAASRLEIKTVQDDRSRDRRWWKPGSAASVETLSLLLHRGCTLEGLRLPTGSAHGRSPLAAVRSIGISAQNLALLLRSGWDLPGGSIFGLLSSFLDDRWAYPEEERLENAAHVHEALTLLVRRRYPLSLSSEIPIKHPDYKKLMCPLFYIIELRPGIDLLRQILATDVDINPHFDHPHGTDLYSESPLETAAQSGDLELVIELVSRGSTITSKENRSPLCSSLPGSDPAQCLEIARYLLERGADPSAAGQDEVPLVLAAFHGHLSLVRLLLENGADINSRSVSGSCRGALEAACYCTPRNDNVRLDTVKLLLDYGAKPDPPADYTGPSALQIACSFYFVYSQSVKIGYS